MDTSTIKASKSHLLINSSYSSIITSLRANCSLRTSASVADCCLLSRNLLARWGGPFEYGDYIIVEGCNGKYDGIWQVKDTMNPKWVKRVDILRTPGSKQFKYNNITLTKYGTDDNNDLAWGN